MTTPGNMSRNPRKPAWMKASAVGTVLAEIGSINDSHVTLPMKEILKMAANGKLRKFFHSGLMLRMEMLIG